MTNGQTVNALWSNKIGSYLPIAKDIWLIFEQLELLYYGTY